MSDYDRGDDLITDHGKMFQMTIPVNDHRPIFSDPQAEEDLETLRRALGAGAGEAHRVATPDKEAIMELSTSYDKRRLRKQQQVLQDAAQRCRVQEINDLSGAITKKCKLSKFENKQGQRESTFHSGLYNTTRMAESHRQVGGEGAENTEKENSSGEQPPSPTFFERTNTMFPLRGAKRHERGEHPSTSKSMPLLQIGYSKGVRPGNSYPRLNLAKSRKINGPIQLRHYLQPRQDHLAPLILPSIRYIGYKKDRLDNYINSKKLLLGPRDSNGHSSHSPHYETTSLPPPVPSTRSNTSYGHWNSSRSALGVVNLPGTGPINSIRSSASQAKYNMS